MKTTTYWKKNLEFDSQFEQFTIQNLNGGNDEEGNRLGFSPKALLLTGLAGCSGIDVVDILKKKKVIFTSLEIITEAETTETHPKIFTAITIVYKVHTAPENLEKVKQAVELSLTKYCGVSAMLGKNSPITPVIEIV
jgi:putative redox protein